MDVTIVYITTEACSYDEVYFNNRHDDPYGGHPSAGQESH